MVTVEFKHVPYFGLFHSFVVFLAVEVRVSLALYTLNQLLFLSLSAIHVELTVVGFTVTVDR
jgi:hypothetical protein